MGKIDNEKSSVEPVGSGPMSEERLEESYRIVERIGRQQSSGFFIAMESEEVEGGSKNEGRMKMSNMNKVDVFQLCLSGLGLDLKWLKKYVLIQELDEDNSN